MGVRAVCTQRLGLAEAAVTALATLRQFQTGCVGVPMFISRQLKVVLNTNSPVAGLTIALRSALVIRGGRNPRLVLCRSSRAEGLATAPPMTVWAWSRGRKTKIPSRQRAAGKELCGG
jgi:hypothetical protein